MAIPAKSRSSQRIAADNGDPNAAPNGGINGGPNLETRYRRAFEAAMDGILILDATSGEVVDANPFLLDLLGYSLAELAGMKLWEIGRFKDIAASESAFSELQAQDYIRYENLPLEAKNGQRREVEFVSNAYFVDGKRFIQCNIRDITARKRTDDERRLLAEVLDERSLNEIYFYDAETLQFVYVNEGGRSNLGLTLEQLRTMTVLEIRPEFTAESYRAMLGPLLRKEEGLHVYQTTQRRADGTVYPVEVHLQFIDREGNGSFWPWHSTSRNASGRRGRCVKARSATGCWWNVRRMRFSCIAKTRSFLRIRRLCCSLERSGRNRCWAATCWRSCTPTRMR
jgi:PAS domain S-box-containing protein